jgi:hypothetical protein
MSDTETPKSAKTSRADPAINKSVVVQSPADALTAAVETLIVAAEAYAAADGTTTHSYVAGDYRVRFQGEQLLRVERI